MTRKSAPTFNAHESAQMLRVHGMPLASFPHRLAAFLMDFFIAFTVFAVLIVGGAKVAVKLGVFIPDAKLKFDFEHWYSLVFLVLYFSLTTYWWNGQTPGKKLLKIRVLSLSHDHMGFWQSVERALGYGASFLEFGFGFVQFFLNPNRRTVHDRIAETIVVDDRQTGRTPGNPEPQQVSP